ncbi:MAG TPA: DNA-formamidopyrimidine glycosylase family protein [Kofleriaceae bacterium]|jgi:endonuclease-8
MPEGDTIHRIANRLAPLVGEIVERVTQQGLERDLAGLRIARIEATGKHLEIELVDDAHKRDTTIRAHLGMYGALRSFSRAAGEAQLQRMSPGRVTLALVTAKTVQLWINARTIEVSARRAPRHGMAIRTLGHDVLAPDFDPRAAAERAAKEPDRTLAAVLLDQRIAAGIGNVYKCEVAFAVSLDPRTLVRDISVDRLEECYAVARDQMVPNLAPGPRTTRQAQAGDRPNDTRYFVYGRGGKPCRTCGAPISVYKLGEPPRWTWSCPRCQQAPDDPARTATGTGS